MSYPTYDGPLLKNALRDIIELAARPRYVSLNDLELIKLLDTIKARAERALKEAD